MTVPPSLHLRLSSLAGASRPCSGTGERETKGGQEAWEGKERGSGSHLRPAPSRPVRVVVRWPTAASIADADVDARPGFKHWESQRPRPPDRGLAICRLFIPPLWRPFFCRAHEPESCLDQGNFQFLNRLDLTHDFLRYRRRCLALYTQDGRNTA